MAGRPTKYTDKLADLILSRIIDGESVNVIFKDNTIPSRSTFYKWLTENDIFSDKYAQAMEQRSLHIGQNMIDIADDCAKDSSSETIDIHKARLQIDARDKYLARMTPRKYEIGGDGKKPIKTEQQIVFIPVGKDD